MGNNGVFFILCYYSGLDPCTLGMLLNSVPSCRPISGSAKFWLSAKIRQKMRPLKTPPNFRKSVSCQKNPAKFGWVGLYRKCINWLSFTPHLLLQTMLNASSVLWDWISAFVSLFRAWQLQAAFLTVTLILTVLSLQQCV